MSKRTVSRPRRPTRANQTPLSAHGEGLGVRSPESRSALRLPSARRGEVRAHVRARATAAWLLPPLAIGLGARLALFALGAVGFQLLRGARLPGVLAIWEQWDAYHYIGLAMHGYHYAPYRGSETNFFPLYPITIWLAQHVTRLFVAGQTSYLLAGMAISWLAFLGACVALYRLTLDRFDRPTASGAVLLLAVFPFGFYFGAPFSESLYLLLTLLAFLGVERHRWWWAAAAAMAAGAVRPPGLIVGACVALAYGLDWLRVRHRPRLDGLALGLLPLGAAAYSLYCWVRFGNALAYATSARVGWHVGYLQPGGLLMAADYLTHLGPRLASGSFNHVLYALYVLALVLFLVSVVPIIRLLGLPYALFALASIIVPIATFPTINSLGRYLSVVFPTYIVLAYAVRRAPAWRDVIVIACAALLGLLTVLFVRGYPMA